MPTDPTDAKSQDVLSFVIPSCWEAMRIVDVVTASADRAYGMNKAEPLRAGVECSAQGHISSFDTCTSTSKNPVFLCLDVSTQGSSLYSSGALSNRGWDPLLHFCLPLSVFFKHSLYFPLTRQVEVTPCGSMRRGVGRLPAACVGLSGLL